MLRFEVFMAVTVGNAVFWDVMPLALVRTEVQEGNSEVDHGRHTNRNRLHDFHSAK
jgi:hypothetical protein